RVTEMAKRGKQEAIKKEQKAEKILELLAKEVKGDVKKIYGEIIAKVFEKYEFLFELFQDVATDKAKLSDFIPEKYSKELGELIKSKIKIERIEIRGILKLESFDSKGLEKKERL
ncbi:hypothetical protein ACFLZ7_04245, partial [Nanoarchaeota archaeon]